MMQTPEVATTQVDKRSDLVDIERELIGFRERDRRVDRDPEISATYTALFNRKPLTLTELELVAQQKRIKELSIQDLPEPDMLAVDPFARLNIADLETLFKEYLHVDPGYKIPRNPLILKALFGKNTGSFKDPREVMIQYDEKTRQEKVNLLLLKELYDLINLLSAELSSYPVIGNSDEFQTFLVSRFAASLGFSFGKRLPLDHMMTTTYSRSHIQASFPHAAVTLVQPLLDNLAYYLLATPFVDNLQNTGTRHMYEDVLHSLYGALFTYVDRPNPVGQNNIHNLCYTLDQLSVAADDSGLKNLLKGTSDDIRRHLADKDGYRLMRPEEKLRLVGEFRHSVQNAVIAIDKKLAGVRRF